MAVVDLATVVAARLTTQLAGARAVYAYGVPAGDLLLIMSWCVPRRFRGPDTARRIDQRYSPVVFVTSVCRASGEGCACRGASWASRKIVDALTDWRPTIGAAAHLPTHFSATPPTLDTSLPGSVAFVVDEFTFPYQT